MNYLKQFFLTNIFLIMLCMFFSRAHLTTHLTILYILILLNIVYTYTKMESILKKDNIKNNTKAIQCDTKEMVISAIQRERHRYLNEIQMLFAYSRLKKYPELDEYIEKIADKYKKVGILSKVYDRNLNYLLYTKQTEAEDKGIELEFFIENRIKEGLAEEFLGYISTILDYYITEISKQGVDTKICVTLYENEDEILLIFKSKSKINWYNFKGVYKPIEISWNNNNGTNCSLKYSKGINKKYVTV